MDQWFLNISVHQTHLEGWFRHKMLGSNPSIGDSVGVAWSLIIFISSNFPDDDADASGPWTTL